MLDNFKREIDKLINDEFHNEYEHGFHAAMVCVRNMIDFEEEDVEKLRRKITSLRNEYYAYHMNTDYWRGVKYVLDYLEEK